MKCLIVLMLSVSSAFAGQLKPGVYTVAPCPAPVISVCPPATVCAEAQPCPTCADCPAPVLLQPESMLLPVRADCPDARLGVVAVAKDPPRKVLRAAAWIGGALLFRHVILALDDHDGRDVTVYNSCKGNCD